MPEEHFAPTQPFSLVRGFIPRRWQPFLRGLRKRWSRTRNQLIEPYRTVYPFTQVALVRQQNLVHLAKDIDDRGVAGCVVECGVLDGGTAALMAAQSNNSPRPRTVHLFDSWEGLPHATAADGEEAAKWSRDVIGSTRRVRQVLSLLNVSSDRVCFHVGWFEETFPKAGIGPIALLHIDADFYASVRLSLDTWYPRLSPGGFIQIDDYDSFSGCQKATNEFLAAHPRPELRSTGTRTKAYYLQKLK